MTTFGNWIGAIGLMLTLFSGVCLIESAFKDRGNVGVLGWVTSGFVVVVIIGVLVASMPR